jgi:hypothetical protein
MSITRARTPLNRGPLFDELLYGATRCVAESPSVDWTREGVFVIHESSSPLFHTMVEHGSCVIPCESGGRIAHGALVLDHFARMATAFGVDTGFDGEVPALLAAGADMVVVGIPRPS